MNRTVYPTSSKARALGGAIAGIIAALIMAFVAMTRASSLGFEFFLPMKQVAATLYGVDALIAGTAVAVVGLVVHLLNSAAWGAVFGLLIGDRFSLLVTLLAGLVWGVVVWGVMTWLVLPRANGVMFDRVMVMPTWWFVYHLVFGGALVMTPALVRSFAQRRGGEAPVAGGWTQPHPA